MIMNDGPCRWKCIVLLVTGAFAWAGPGRADPPTAFEKKVLTDRFHAEAAGLGDIDKDGHADAVYGPYWYAGPACTKRFEIYLTTS
jgi:hypothetical protein